MIRIFACLMSLTLSLAPAVAKTQKEVRPMPDSPIEAAVELMAGFAERTGLSSERPQQRYLWTDAFAVCNFIGLSRTTGEKRYMGLALRIVIQRPELHADILIPECRMSTNELLHHLNAAGILKHIDF